LLLRLRRCWPATAPFPVLLADRGFDKAPLLSWLIGQGWRFIVRIKRGNHLYDEHGHLLNDAYDADGHRVQMGPLHPGPGKQLLFPQITSYPKERLPLHLAVSAIRDPKTLTVEEWRLVTNLPVEHLGPVPKLYGQRMPPEEVHRDSKHGFAVSGFGLCHMGRLRADRLGTADLHVRPDLRLLSAGGGDGAGEPRVAVRAALGPVPGTVCARPAPCCRCETSPDGPPSLCFRSPGASLAYRWGLLRGRISVDARRTYHTSKTAPRFSFREGDGNAFSCVTVREIG
jgi:hypothetical protein